MTTINVPDDFAVVTVANKFMSDHGIGPFTAQVGDLPPQSVASLLARGAAHLFGNVLSSAHLSAIRGEVAGDGKQSDVTQAQVDAYRTANPDETKRLAAEQFTRLVELVTSGKLGMPSERSADSAPRNPIEVEMRNLAVDTIRKVLAAKGLTAKRDFSKPVDGLELPDGNGGTFVPNMNDLIARQLTGSKQAEYHQKASRIVAARNRAVEESADL